MDEDQWAYDNTMSQEVDMDYENEQECGVNEPHVDCSDAFNTSQVIMFIILSYLIECMFCIKNKLSGLCVWFYFKSSKMAMKYHQNMLTTYILSTNTTTFKI